MVRREKDERLLERLVPKVPTRTVQTVNVYNYKYVALHILISRKKVLGMAKWFLSWEVEPAFIPGDPKERVQLWMTLTQWVIDDMKAGKLKDWGMRSGELGGYAVASDMSEAELNSWLMKWMPYIKFQANPVLTAQQNMAGLQQAVKMLKKA
jgi:hypothetical protein